MKITATINGVSRTLEFAANANLLDVLRAAGYKSVKFGCGEGHCGACTVEFNGRPRNACLLFAAQADGADIVTVEGLGTPAQPHVIQQAFVDAGATQCGYCVPGFVISAKALLERNSSPTEDEVKSALDGNLCRCTGYVKRIEAVMQAAKTLRRSTSGGRRK